MRYAIYYTPEPGSPLHAFGCAALGYDADRGQRVAFHPALEQDGCDIEALTASPRRYGFHATLKAPFALVDGAGEDDLLNAVAALARSLAPVALGRLEVVSGRDFIGLRPQDRRYKAAQALAQQCVEALDAFRAPLTDHDRARRRPDQLTSRQRAQLEKWGYPFVADDFEFHMTLAGPYVGPASSAVPDRLAAVLSQLWQRQAQDVVIDSLTVSCQDTRESPFRNIARLSLPTAQM